MSLKNNKLTLPQFLLLLTWTSQGKSVNSAGKSTFNISAISKFKSDLLKTNEAIAPQSREILQFCVVEGTNLSVVVLFRWFLTDCSERSNCAFHSRFQGYDHLLNVESLDKKLIHLEEEERCVCCQKVCTFDFFTHSVPVHTYPFLFESGDFFLRFSPHVAFLNPFFPCKRKCSSYWKRYLLWLEHGHFVSSRARGRIVDPAPRRIRFSCIHTSPANGVFENFGSGEWFEKMRFRWPFSPTRVDDRPNQREKNLHFQTQTDTCGVDGDLNI